MKTAVETDDVPTRVDIKVGVSFAAARGARLTEVGVAWRNWQDRGAIAE
jgi:hypothetical protein